MPNTYMRPSFIVAAFLAVAGCSASPETGQTDVQTVPSQIELRKALQTYFDAHPECTPFFDIPAEARMEQGSYRIRQLDAFVAAGVLQRTGEIMKPHQVTGVPEQYARYISTPLGEHSLRPSETNSARTQICYGKRKVISVTSGGLDENFPDRLSVKYDYQLIDVPAWTSSRAIIEFYPGLGKRLTGATESDGEDLMRVNGSWTLPKQTAFGSFDFTQEGH
ncbi:hypothetical protein D3Y57_00405 (plasmid) [Sphingomonas paeninsulae]|uniref:Uncharacterized protein n=1 Tax=Sphingomonas paeninsulae TaxID=2319844 RepID=A0A494TFC5_SPHPE|nr:hypothetical protein [Sphingomonas paeninsulae]AYJ84606.1 hypothetical protein D3Y57_00405 [Sphingomonas paeninsulae]